MTNRRILIVDDSPAIHEDFRKILVQSKSEAQDALAAMKAALFDDEPTSMTAGISYTLDSAHQGDEALELVDRAVRAGQPYAMVFMDMRMPPGRDGLSTVQEIWSRHPELEVVFCTAYSDYSWEEIIARLGISDRLLFLKKPFETAEVQQLALALTTKWALAEESRSRVYDLQAAVEEKTAVMSLLHCAAVTANQSTSLRDSAGTVMKAICERSGWMLARARFYRGASGCDSGPFEVWHSVDPVKYPPQHFDSLGFAAVHSFPMVVGANVLGTLELFSTSVNPAKRDILEAIPQIGAQLGCLAERLQKELDLVRLKEAAESASNAKTEFLANTSHEIRTPINGILGSAELLKMTALAPDQRDYLDIIRTSAHGLLTVINDVLDFSKIEAGKLQIEQIPVDLKSVVRDVVVLLAQAAEEKGLELIARFEADVPRHVIGDPGRIRQVLTNLAGNAIKFTAEGQVVVSVSLEKSTSMVKLSVLDTGIGIPPEDQERLFEKFTQADASTTRKHGGTGLGLAISKHLAHLMRGDIGVNSKPKVGSTFWMTLPLVLAPAPAELRPSFDGKRVAIAGGHPMMRAVLEELLCGWNIEVSNWNDHDADARLNHALASGVCFDAMIVDERLPELNRFLSKIKEPAILLTSYLNRGASSVSPNIELATRLRRPICEMDLTRALWAALDPEHADATSTIPPVDRSDLVKSAAGLRVLLAEDNPVNIKVTSRLLELLGCVVDVAINGLEAVERASLQTYDLILMDCQMPEMDGFHAARVIRDAGSAAGAPIIALTANTMQDAEHRCREAGMDAYVAKPISKRDLSTLLEVWSPAAYTLQQACLSSRSSES